MKIKDRFLAGALSHRFQFCEHCFRDGSKTWSFVRPLPLASSDGLKFWFICSTRSLAHALFICFHFAMILLRVYYVLRQMSLVTLWVSERNGRALPQTLTTLRGPIKNIKPFQVAQALSRRKAMRLGPRTTNAFSKFLGFYYRNLNCCRGVVRSLICCSECTSYFVHVHGYLLRTYLVGKGTVAFRQKS